MRQLKFHEQRLLKKVDFIQYKKENQLRENTVMQKYALEKREEYLQYNIICGQIRKAANMLSLLDPKDTFREERTKELLEKLYRMGIISSLRLIECEKITVSQYIKQGHVRVGPNIVTDPAFLVTRTLEDYVTWSDSSKIKQKVLKYNDELDDFDLL